jgi:hypothetical protein
MSLVPVNVTGMLAMPKSLGSQIPLRSASRYYAGKEDSHARADEPDAPAREGMAAAAMHLLARRARMRIATASTNLGP